jgi:surfeit locus 1 family protein
MFGVLNKRFMRKTITILLLIIAEFILISLGTWQLYRLDYKTQLIETISKQAHLPAVNEVVEPIEYYRQVKLHGKLLTEKIVYVYSLNEKGEAGYDVIVPYKTGEKVIPVKYEWVKEKNHDKMNDKITGMIIPISGKNKFTPDNNPTKNIWYYVDLDQLEKFTDRKLLPALIIRNANPDIFKTSIRNDHFGYAVIWYSFAAILLIISYINAINVKQRKKPT